MAPELFDAGAQEAPKPDLYFVPDLAVPETQHNINTSLFVDKWLPIYFDNIRIFRALFKKHVEVKVDTFTLEGVLNQSGNEIALRYWQRQQQEGNLRGIVFRPEDGRFIDPDTEQEISVKEVINRKKRR